MIEKQVLESHKAVEKGMKEGYISLKNVKMVICGPPCVGKTAFKALLLNNPRPLKHHSTPIATRPVQAIERIAAGEKVWVEVTEEDSLCMLFEELIESACGTDTIYPNEVNNPVIVDSQMPPLHEDVPATSSIHSSPTNPSSMPPEVATENLDDVYNKLASQLALLEQRNEPQKLQEATWIHLLDSGGQPQFTDLLRMFVRDNSLYIIVMKATESLHDKPKFVYSVSGQSVTTPHEITMTNLQIIEKFVRSVAATSRDSRKPAFAIVATHVDQLKKLVALKEADRQIKESLNKFLNLFIFNNCDSMELIFPVNNLCCNNREKISADIRSRLISSCPTIDVKIPVRWYAFDLIMKKEAATEMHRMISLESCKKIGQRRLSMSQTDIEECLVYLDSMRLCIYYPNILPHVVFTSPQFLIDCLSNIVLVSFADNLKQILPEVVSLSAEVIRSLKRDGIFDELLLDSLKLPFVPNLFSKSELIKLLKSFCLIAPVRRTDDTLQYFIPILLPAEKLSERHKTLLTTNIEPLVIALNSKLVLQVSHH